MTASAVAARAASQVRSDGDQRFIFVMNFAPEKRQIDLGDRTLTDLFTGEEMSGVVAMEGFGVKVLR